mgnify:CR=1 FL=1
MQKHTESSERILGFISGTPMTRELHPRILETLASVARTECYAEGDYLFRRDDPADFCHIIQEGNVWLQDRGEGGEVHVWQLGPGDMAGWSWLVPPHRYLLDARAATPVVSVVLDAFRLREMIESDHELVYQLLKRCISVAASRIRSERLERVHASPWA